MAGHSLTLGVLLTVVRIFCWSQVVRLTPKIGEHQTSQTLRNRTSHVEIDISANSLHYRSRDGGYNLCFLKGKMQCAHAGRPGNWKDSQSLAVCPTLNKSPQEPLEEGFCQDDQRFLWSPRAGSFIAIDWEPKNRITFWNQAMERKKLKIYS